MLVKIDVWWFFGKQNAMEIEGFAIQTKMVLNSGFILQAMTITFLGDPH